MFWKLCSGLFNVSGKWNTVFLFRSLPFLLCHLTSLKIVCYRWNLVCLFLLKSTPTSLIDPTWPHSLQNLTRSEYFLPRNHSNSERVYRSERAVSEYDGTCYSCSDGSHRLTHPCFLLGSLACLPQHCQQGQAFSREISANMKTTFPWLGCWRVCTRKLSARTILSANMLTYIVIYYKYFDQR